jgi:hypothetical protein
LHVLRARLGVITAIAFLIVSAWIGAAVVVRDRTDTTPMTGPLDPHIPADKWFRTGGTMSPGQVYAYAGPSPLNATSRPAVLDSVQVQGLPESVKIVRVATLYPPAFSNGPFPFVGPNRQFRTAHFQPLRGTVIPPGTVRDPGTQEIVFFLSPSVPGVYVTAGVWVSYHIGSEAFRYFEPVQWALCVLPVSCPEWA